MNRTTASSQNRYANLAIGLLVTLLVTNTLHAQCPPNPDPATTHPNGVIEGPVSCLGDESANSTVGIDHLDRFIVSFERPLLNRSQIWALRFEANGTPIGNTAAITDTAINTDRHHVPSLAMSRNSLVRVGWLGNNGGGGAGLPDTLLISDFDFDAFLPMPTPAPDGSRGDDQHSMGISDGAAGQVFFSDTADAPRMGLVYQVGTGPITQLRGCGQLAGGSVCFIFD